MRENLHGFDAETFARRRAAVFQALDGGVLLLPAAPVQVCSRDTERRYRPDSDLFYLTGCTEPGVLAILSDAREEERFLLFVPERDPKAERWSGTRPDPEELRVTLGADAAFQAGEMRERLPGFLAETRALYVRLGTDSEVESLVMDALRQARVGGARTGTGPRAVVDPGRILDDLRLRKDPEEILRIRQATALTVASFRGVMPEVRSGMGEWEVEALLEARFRKGGAQGPAFPTIVGSGSNACVLHYSANEHPVEPGALVLLDGGADLGLYCGDVTRTFPASAAFSPEQRAVYDVVLQAHSAALDIVRPGATIGAVHAAAAEALTRGLIGLGVLSEPVQELIEGRTYERFFPHQTSHWLGLDVHDVGDYAVDGSPRVLEPGMVLTVEPGLYFSPQDDESAMPFQGIGVRIEDDLLVTEEGAENLTADLPVEPEEVEAMLGS